MKRLLRDLLNFWDRFFFGQIDPLPLGVFRFFLGANLFIMAAIRQVHWRFYFTDEGFLKSEFATHVLPEFFRPAISWHPTTPTAALVMHSLFLVSLFLMMIGFKGRLFAAVSLFLHLAFMQRNFAIAYGVDIVTCFFLFGLAVADSSRRFSVEAWFKREPRQMHPINSMLTTIGVRLVQIQLCIIYGYTGLEKMKGGSWWDGTAVWTVFGNQQIMMLDLSWLMNYPFVIGAMTFSALLFEVYFPVLVWVRPVRKWVLIYGWLMHTGIALFIGLYFFSGAMMFAYILFIDPKWLRAILIRFLPERWLGR